MRPNTSDWSLTASPLPDLVRAAPTILEGTPAAWADLTNRAIALRDASFSPADRGLLSALLAGVLAFKRVIEKRAYEKWMGKGCPSGTELQDWAEAEAELAHELNLPRTFANLGDQVRCWERDRRFQAANHLLTRTLSEASSLEAAAPGCLRAVAAALGWKVAVFWVFDRRVGALRCADWWSYPVGFAATLEGQTRGAALGAGVGLPGRAWADSQIAVVTDLACDDDARARAAADDGLGVAFAIPVRGHQRVWAVLELFDADGPPPDERAVELLEDLTSQISQFAERREAETLLSEQREERRLARLIQQGFLPKIPPVLPGFLAYGASLPAESVGGDYFDFVPMTGGSLGIVIGDVSGHGVGAALTMGQVRACMRALALTHTDPTAILGLCNRRLCEDLAADIFTTLFFARLDAPTRMLTYSNAGHWPGYVLSAGTDVKHQLESTGPPLGVVAEIEFPTESVELAPGDLVLLFTDGIIEAAAPDGRPFGLGRALDAVRAHRHEHPSEITEALFRAVRAFTGQPPADDITAVVIRA